jgi:cytochrome c peroxidase
MKKVSVIVVTFISSILIVSFVPSSSNAAYTGLYVNKLDQINESFEQLKALIIASKLDAEGKKNITEGINQCRRKVKACDIWLRYFEPISYKLINGPLPIEWETEVFEKFEKPYKREGSGLTLMNIYLDEENVSRDSLLHMTDKAINALMVFKADSITKQLNTPDVFYLSNRLYLLNMAAIYTSGFECPNTEMIITELQHMLEDSKHIYQAFNLSFPEQPLNNDYLILYDETISFVKSQSHDHEKFDHFTFIKDFVNPLFKLNQLMIQDYNIVSKSNNDYSLNKKVTSIFSKQLYHAQNTRGVFNRVTDEEAIQEITKLGKLLFYDPILSGNNLRSCSSCHSTTQNFTDTAVTTALQYNRKDRLNRNTPSLINSNYNHLVMLDGFHLNLQNQANAVMTNEVEMGGDKEEILKKVLSIELYKDGFKKLLSYTPQEKEISINHIASALTFYYAKFSNYYSPFDMIMNGKNQLNEDVKKGFNVFMSKAQCATCHFVPQFNGVKPPYIGSEFEVLGVPADTKYTSLSSDRGRYEVNPANETLHAFRTGTLRNIMKTMPYMHNGVFKTMDDVLEFYNGGGGAGRGLIVNNQTLSKDSLHLTKSDKYYLIKFLESLTEEVPFEQSPAQLPASKKKSLNIRKVNGEY